MRVLQLHNRYRQRGGEDAVAESEARLLREHGVEVLALRTANPEGVAGLVTLGLESAWSRRSYDELRRVCARFRPDVVHVHNFWMRFSPSVLAACRDSGAATVLTLHNFRLLCANGNLYRNGATCEDCVGRAPWRGVVNRCYRGSYIASAAMARMIVENRRRGTWERDVDAFIALSRDAAAKLAAGGIPASRMFLKPNFVEDPGPPQQPPSASTVVVYAGRLAEEKGVATLVSAWAVGRLHELGTLVIAGDGPERPRLEAQAGPGVTFTGPDTPEGILRLLSSARTVVLPTLFYESFPRILAETLAAGRPAIVSGFGATAEIIAGGKTGLHFPAGDAGALAGALRTILTDGVLADRLGENARADYLAQYTPERNYELLTRIYHAAIDRRRAPLGVAAAA